MSRVRLLGILLMFYSLGASSQAAWLSDLISEKDRPHSENQRAQPAQTGQDGFYKNHGFILFYGSQCPHCKQFAPVLKEWVSQNHVRLLPLSLDNQPLVEFPNFLPATTEWINAAFQGNPINYPALFIVNPETKQLFPVGFGSMSFFELSSRMEQLVPKIRAYERKGGVL
ncbi:MAG: type-F conjugative transfer system pilin assembly thiol-disulfide isomerase TrbB [Legionella sp.]|uniref:type-F conjugative transfer system pilin assembly thiol-disulfide isomerase TrbB n=1 Tax=Legionella sp. TaxID=459 RepID=UPI0039E61436